MLIEDFGIVEDKFFTALADPGSGLIEVDIVTNSATRISAINPATGYTTTFTGSGLGLNESTGTASGTATGLEIRDGTGALVLRISQFSWGFGETVAALSAAIEDDDSGPLAGLLNRQAVTYDARASDLPIELDFGELTVNVTFLGSAFDDWFHGGSGRDSLYGNDGRDTLMGGGQDDLLDASGGAATTQLWGDFVMPGYGQNTIIGHRALWEDHNDGIDLSYDNVSGVGGLTFDIGANGTGTVVAGTGFNGIPYVNDTFTYAHFFTGSRDGDLFNGSDEDRFEGFVGGGGADTVHGNGGFDRLAYDFENQILGSFGGIFANLAAGTVIDTQGDTDVFTGIEEIVGSQRNDVIDGRGTSFGMRLLGEGGNDTIFGTSGDDRLDGGAGDDSINPGAAGNYDLIWGSYGNDTVNYADVVLDSDGFNALTFDRLDDGVTVDIDTGTGTAQVATSNGTTRILALERALDDGNGLEIVGGRGASSFDIVTGAGTYLSLSGGAGNDSFLISTEGTVRLDYRGGYFGGATQGVVADLAAGIVGNDGFGGRDTITVSLGAGGRFQFRGSDLADRVTGSARDEEFRMRAGNDTVDGGGGIDLLNYDRDETGALAVDLAAGSATGSWNGGAFTDTLAGIENVRGGRVANQIAGSTGANELQGGRDSTDALYGQGGADRLRGEGGDDLLVGDLFSAAIDDHAGTVYRLYQATLGRAPDQGGLLNWAAQLDGGAPLVGIAAGFTGSREFQRDYGGLDDAGFVTLLYNNVLERDPDAGGLADWTGRLAAGASRAEVVTGFSESREFVQNTRIDSLSAQTAGWQADWGDDVFRLYQATLGRAPDVGGFEDWTGRLATGTPYLTAITGFTNSTEFTNRYGATSDEQFVTLLYDNVLGRDPDTGGLADWTGRLGAGTSRAEVVSGFAQSREFINNTDAAYTAWSWAQDDDDIRGGSGSNLLMGGILSDVFVFEAGDGGSHVVADFETWDRLAFRGFGYGDDADVRARMTQSGDDVLFSDQGESLRIVDTQLSAITDAQIELWT